MAHKPDGSQLDEVNPVGAVVFSHVAHGIVTFAYDPPPAQSAQEFRKSFAESFQDSLVSQIEPASTRIEV
jgi:hypothetical protein